MLLGQGETEALGLSEVTFVIVLCNLVRGSVSLPNGSPLPYCRMFCSNETFSSVSHVLLLYVSSRDDINKTTAENTANLERKSVIKEKFL